MHGGIGDGQGRIADGEGAQVDLLPALRIALIDRQRGGHLHLREDINYELNDRVATELVLGAQEHRVHGRPFVGRAVIDGRLTGTEVDRIVAVGRRPRQDGQMERIDGVATEDGLISRYKRGVCLWQEAQIPVLPSMGIPYSHGEAVFEGIDGVHGEREGDDRVTACDVHDRIAIDACLGELTEIRIRIGLAFTDSSLVGIIRLRGFVTGTGDADLRRGDTVRQGDDCRIGLRLFGGEMDGEGIVVDLTERTTCSRGIAVLGSTGIRAYRIHQRRIAVRCTDVEDRRFGTRDRNVSRREERTQVDLIRSGIDDVHHLEVMHPGGCTVLTRSQEDMLRQADVLMIDDHFVGWQPLAVILDPVDITADGDRLVSLRVVVRVLREGTYLIGAAAAVSRLQHLCVDLAERAQPVQPLVPPADVERTGSRSKDVHLLVTLRIEDVLGIVVQRVPHAVAVSLGREPTHTEQRDDNKQSSFHINEFLHHSCYTIHRRDGCKSVRSAALSRNARYDLALSLRLLPGRTE